MEKMVVNINMINQLLYCEHRAFLMHACGEMENNEHIWIGKKVHFTADSGKTTEIKEKTVYRNIYVSSEELGLVGVIDVLEKENDKYLIVEYKKGKPQLNKEAWLNDFMQVQAQAVCLKSMGVNVIGGVIFYGTSKQRVFVAISENSFTDVDMYAERLRSIALGDIITVPKLNPKCFGCSLQNICNPTQDVVSNNDYWSEDI